MIPKLVAFLITSTVAFLGCRNNQSEKAKVHYAHSSINRNTGTLIPIDANDTNYLDVKAYAYDIVTQSGWSIKYFVRDDSTRYNDLYIQWSKGDIKQIYNAKGVLQLRRYFIPSFIGESKSHLFLWHGCATGCQAVLAFEKGGKREAHDHLDVVDWNIESNKIVAIPNSAWFTEPSLGLVVYDLNKHRNVKVGFHNLCMASFKPYCIDTVLFTNTTVTIKATLTDKADYYRERQIAETRKVVFE